MDTNLQSSPSSAHMPANSSISRKESEQASADDGSESTYHSPTSSEHFHLPHADSGKTLPMNMLIPSCFRFDPTICEILRRATAFPPITKTSLLPLDLNHILANIKLRCEINYDPDLHFTPSAGDRGEEKRREARRYWLALGAEFRIYLHNSQHCNECQRNSSADQHLFQQRLPTMLEDLRDLLLTLVPDRDHDEVASHLDVAFLMQQVQHGVIDVINMSVWLANLLKLHCAPMRDRWAEEMALTIEKGATNGDVLTLMAGLEKLFSFLEAMKLDVANHQIRTFRVLLIEQTVEYQKAYFLQKIHDRSVSIDFPQSWYERAKQDHHFNCDVNPHKVPVPAFTSFLHGLTQLCNPYDRDVEIPITFHFDQDRLLHYRETVQERVYLNMCLSVFDELIRNVCKSQCLPSSFHQSLQQRILAISHDDCGQGVAQRWSRYIDAIAIEISRAAYSLCRYPSLSVPDEDLKAVAQYLRRNFQETYKAHTDFVMSELEMAIAQHAKVFKNMSALSIAELQRQDRQERIQKAHGQPIPDLDDIARKLAHLGVLHWWIWAEFSYLKGVNEGEDEANNEEPTERKSPTLSVGDLATCKDIHTTDDLDATDGERQASGAC